jgi:hypothetical protein
VLHEHGPRGKEAVWCDGSGRFRIGNVPAGAVQLTAESSETSRTPDGTKRVALRHGTRLLHVTERERRTGVAIEVE